MRSIIVLWVVAGCGGAGSESECGPLEPGAYRVDVAWVSGDCGDSMQQVVVVQADGTIQGADGCEGSDVRLDACAVAFDRRCSVVDELTGEVVGTARYDGALMSRRTSASGTMEIVGASSDGAVSCRGLYEVTYTQI